MLDFLFTHDIGIIVIYLGILNVSVYIKFLFALQVLDSGENLMSVVMNLLRKMHIHPNVSLQSY